MQSNNLILASAIAALALCALPYGCSGKYVDDERPANSGTAGKTSAAGAQYITDGSYSPPRDGQNHGDGAYRPGGDGTYVSGDGGYIREGYDFSDGFDDASDGIGGPYDGTSVSEGQADGWADPQPDGLDDSHSDGWADGAPIP